MRPCEKNSKSLGSRIIRTQRSNDVVEPDDADAPSLLQILSRQIGQDRLIYLVHAECRLILPEAQAPQPDHDVHATFRNSGLPRIMVLPRGGV